MRIESASGSAPMRCTSALLLYETDTGGVQNTGEIAASMHEVARPSESAPPMLLPGQPLTTDALNDIYRKLAGSQKTSRAMIPTNLLCHDAGRLIWFVPSARRLIFFKTRDKAFDEEINGKQVLHPALLFVAENRTLYIFALDNDERPNGKTKLYHAPYMNIYERGSMCSGNGRVPDGCRISDMERWEKLFFETNFSHTNRDARQLTKHPGGHNGLWRELARSRGRGVHKIFPVRYLAPEKRKLESLLNGEL